MKDKMISIILPVYNIEAYLSHCLDSLIHQTYSKLEIICVDDGSQDRSSKIIQEYARRDSRIHLIQQANGGPSMARNAGMKAATGEYIGFVDPDDWVELDMYEKLVSMIAELQVDLVICGISPYSDKKKKATEKSPFFLLETFDSRLQGVKLAGKELITHQYFFGHFVWNRLYRRDFLEKNQICFPVGKFYEDCFFSIDVDFAAENFSFTQEPLYWYRRKRTGSTIDQKNRGREDRIQFLEYLYLKTRGAGLLDEEEVRFWEYAFSVLDGLLAEDIYELIRRFVLTYSISQKAMDSSFILQEKRRVYETCSSYGELLRKEETLKWYMPFVSRKVKSECIEYRLFGFCISRVSLRRPN